MKSRLRNQRIGWALLALASMFSACRKAQQKSSQPFASKVVSVETAAARPLTVVRPGDPEFDSLLKANYPGIEDIEEYQLARRFIVLLRNDTPIAANAYLVEWEVQTSDGKTHELKSTYIQKDYLGKGADVTLAPGKVCLMSPFLWQPPEPHQVQSFVHVRTPTLADQYSATQVRSVKSQLDAVIFDDGSHAGPDKNQLSGQYACVRLAERDEREAFRQMLQANASEEEIKTRFDRDLAPLRNAALYDSPRLEDFCTLQRGDVAQSLHVGFSFRGVPALRTGLGLKSAPIASSQVSFLMPAEFSADIMGPPELTPDGRRLSAKKGELHMTREKIRVDLESEPTRTVELADVPGKRLWFVYPRGNWARDESAHAGWDALGLPTTFPFNLGLGRPFDPEQPCLGLEGSTCQDMGTDTVDGRTCEKWTVKIARRPDRSEQQFALCIDLRMRIPLRAANYELHKVREGPQEASLFEVPPDFHKVFADGTEEGPAELPFNFGQWIAGSYSSHQGTKIGQIGLSEAEISPVLALLGAEKELRDESGGPTREWFEVEFLARRLDMGEGPDNGLLLQGTQTLCGVTGNCQMWLFRKVNGKWTIVLDDALSAAFKFAPPKHNGLFELMVMGHGSAASTPLSVLWFDGTKYAEHTRYCVVQDHLEEGDCL
jgi:hypothetical protein